ncbi:MAG: hypothetical protein K6V73_05125 [Firmicutes bacterium]|nr:hypothetical protein [Bacillota bacterium]
MRPAEGGVTAAADALALATGAAAAFNPCGVGLLPGYLAFLLGRPAPGRWPLALAEGLGAGAAMTVGILAPFALVALTFGAVAGWLGPRLPLLGSLLGAAFALWGLILLVGAGRAAPVLPIHAPQGGGRGLWGAAVYGTLFALGSLGCTFPLFLSLLLQAAAAGGPLGGARAVALYALGMGAVVTLLAVAARIALVTARRLTARAAALSPRLTGAVVLASGLAVLAYYRYGLVLF